MKNERDCKIVQDLLPNYLEDLTNEETKVFVEEHLKECEECQKQLENMKKDIELNQVKSNKRDVKYIKKFGRKMRILKLIVLVIVLIFVGRTTRNAIIISSLSKKADNTIVSTNYHRTTYVFDKQFSRGEIYKMNSKIKVISIVVADDEVTKRMIFANRIGEDEFGNPKYIANIYTENSSQKTAKLGQEVFISVDPQNILKTQNIWDLIFRASMASVRKDTYNGKECYYITNFETTFGEAKATYVDSNTGLMTGNMSYDEKMSDGQIVRNPMVEYVYEFGTVTDADFIEPDISEYTIISE